MLIIPSIDLRGGRCVRLRQGDFAKQWTYAIEPAALAERYCALGARWLHVVDLDGAKDGRTANTTIIMALARHPSLRLQVGGGVRQPSVIESLLSDGVARVVIGTAAVLRPSEVTLWIKEFGADRICLAFDVRPGAAGKPQVRTDGWTRNSAVSLSQAVEEFPPGLVKHVLCTDIDRDGMLRGPNLRLYRECLAQFPAFQWQASGGTRNSDDLSALKRIGVAAAVTGTALLEERISKKELQPFFTAGEYAKNAPVEAST
jgi:phosphoribosylformimino-5-aminoimidazole carboxamide ribotide isomerase